MITSLNLKNLKIKEEDAKPFKSFENGVNILNIYILIEILEKMKENIKYLGKRYGLDNFNDFLLVCQMLLTS